MEIVVNQGVFSSTDTWNDTATVTPTAADELGGIVKLGSQRLTLQRQYWHAYLGGVDIQAGVVRVQNDLALGAPNGAIGTTVETGAALEFDPDATADTGGVTGGPSIFNTHLTLNGTGNTTFGDAPLTVFQDDNLWAGPVTLNSNVAISFQNTYANQAIATMTANFLAPGSTLTTLLPTAVNPTVDVAATTLGGGGLNAVQMLTFGASPGGAITGGTFTLSGVNGVTPFTTANIAFSPNPNLLIAHITAALNLIFGAGNFNVSLTSPTIDVLPNARLIVTGAVDDASTQTTSGSDLYVAGGGELVLSGANSYRGTTFVNQGILTVQNSSALGGTGVSGAQVLDLAGAIAGSTSFTLAFNGKRRVHGDRLYRHRRGCRQHSERSQRPGDHRRLDAGRRLGQRRAVGPRRLPDHLRRHPGRQNGTLINVPRSPPVSKRRSHCDGGGHRRRQ